MSRRIVHIQSWRRWSTAPHGDVADINFEITHPHHPLRGQRFKLVTYRHNWGEDRVYFHNAEDRLSSIPACWTTVVAPDPFVGVAIAAALTFGLAPALRGSRLFPQDRLREGGRGTAGARSYWLQHSLIVIETALAVVLLTGGGLLLQVFQHLANTDLGIRTEKLLTLRRRSSATRTSTGVWPL